MAAFETSKRPQRQGQSFQTLDAYLAHLKKLGARDYPFYELVEPNRYRLNTGRGRNRRPAKYFTRHELMQKFGFSR